MGGAENGRKKQSSEIDGMNIVEALRPPPKTHVSFPPSLPLPPLVTAGLWCTLHNPAYVRGKEGRRGLVPLPVWLPSPPLLSSFLPSSPLLPSVQCCQENLWRLLLLLAPRSADHWSREPQGRRSLSPWHGSRRACSSAHCAAAHSHRC